MDLLSSHPCLTSLFIRSIRHSEELREIEEIIVLREGVRFQKLQNELKSLIKEKSVCAPLKQVQ